MMYGQNPAAKRALLSTGTLRLVNMSKDDFLGVGEEGRGENWLGKVMMEYRHRLREETFSNADWQACTSLSSMMS